MATETPEATDEETPTPGRRRRRAAGEGTTRSYTVQARQDDGGIVPLGEVQVGRADAAATIAGQNLIDGGDYADGDKLTLLVMPTRNVQEFPMVVETKPRAKIVR